MISGRETQVNSFYSFLFSYSFYTTYGRCTHPKLFHKIVLIKFTHDRAPFFAEDEGSWKGVTLLS